MPDRIIMPPLQYFMVTWGVAGEFGGMTSMCLTRARTLAHHAGVRAPVLTFEVQPDYTEITEALLESGHIVHGTEICNIYHYYRVANLDNRDGISESVGEELHIPSHGIQRQTIRDGEGRVFCRVIRSLDAEREFRREYWRTDETVFLTETNESGEDGNARYELRLLDRSGRTVGKYNSRDDFFRAWMLELAGGEPTVFVADSVKTTRFTGALRAKHVMKMAVMHNSHIRGGGEPLRGRLAMSRRDVTLHSQRWDGIIFLTERHRQDFVDRFGTTNNLFVLSNPFSRAAELPAFSGRVPSRGVMVCRLDPIKNVLAAIETIGIVRQTVPSVRLDIYGSGKQWQELQERINELNLQHNIVLHGHISNAAEEFSRAVFSLLTSRKEGQPLALLESQGHGCPPVSFNIRYGPEDVIQDGHNGFLVEEGDIQSAADKIIDLCLDESLAQRMSTLAWKSSAQYGHVEVLQRFASIVEQAWDQRSGRLGLARMAFHIQNSAIKANGFWELAGSLTWKQNSGPPAMEELAPALQLLPQSGAAPVWIPGEVVDRKDGRLDIKFNIRAEDDLPIGAGPGDRDVFLVVTGRNFRFRERVDLTAL